MSARNTTPPAARAAGAALSPEFVAAAGSLARRTAEACSFDLAAHAPPRQVPRVADALGGAIDAATMDAPGRAVPAGAAAAAKAQQSRGAPAAPIIAMISKDATAAPDMPLRMRLALVAAWEVHSIAELLIGIAEDSEASRAIQCLHARLQELAGCVQSAVGDEHDPAVEIRTRVFPRNVFDFTDFGDLT
jgi:hypothetical protein